MRRLAQLVFPIFVLGMSLSLTRCGGDSTSASTTGACSNGICGSGGGATAGSTSGGPGGAGMTTTGGGGMPSTDATTGSGPCVESWLCTPWDGKGTSNGTRVCTDESKCGTTTSKPSETAALPALDLNFFECNVQPILDAKCSMLGCHGTETGRALRVYSRGKLRDATVASPPANPACPVTPLSTCLGTNDCHCVGPHAPEEWQKNYDAARGLALDAQGNPIPVAQADTSDLIQQPVVGGKAHAGVHLFKPDDAEYTTIKSWLSGSKLASCDPTPN
jgi:hypothetical protein